MLEYDDGGRGLDVFQVQAGDAVEVIPLQYVPSLIERARAQAAGSGVEVDFRAADAQELAFEDDGFDFVLSVYGVQFAPDQERAAAEMLRVCRPGGKIALATPIPRGWGGDCFGVNAKYSPPSTRSRSTPSGTLPDRRSYRPARPCPPRRTQCDGRPETMRRRPA